MESLKVDYSNFTPEFATDKFRMITNNYSFNFFFLHCELNKVLNIEYCDLGFVGFVMI